jgi:hypothetical protein
MRSFSTRKRCRGNRVPGDVGPPEHCLPRSSARRREPFGYCGRSSAAPGTTGSVSPEKPSETGGVVRCSRASAPRHVALKLCLPASRPRRSPCARSPACVSVSSFFAAFLNTGCAPAPPAPSSVSVAVDELWCYRSALRVIPPRQCEPPCASGADLAPLLLKMSPSLRSLSARSVQRRRRPGDPARLRPQHRLSEQMPDR